MEREDGELEDGELDSDEDDEMPPTLPVALPAHVPAAAPPMGGFMPTAPSGFSSSPPPVLTAQVRKLIIYYHFLPTLPATPADVPAGPLGGYISAAANI